MNAHQTNLDMECPPAVTLVMKTKNRGPRLPAFFESVSRIENEPPWELIIVDNGSTDDTPERLKAFAASFAGRIIILTEPRPGGARAYNRGWKAAKAALIAFTDDDCYPHPDYLKNVAAVFEDKTLGFCSGRTLLFDPTDAPITINPSIRERTYNAGEFVDASFIQGCNLMFRREVLAAIGGYDDQFGPGTKFVCEDLDAITRALAAGWKGKYDPRPLIYHHHRRKPGKDVEALLKVYDAGAGAFFTKCILFMPQRWQCLHHWLRRIRHQPLVSTVRQIKSALTYLFHILRSDKEVK